MMTMPGTTTLSMPERRVTSSDTKETRRPIRCGKVQVVRQCRNAQSLVEALLYGANANNRRPVANGRPVLIPEHLVPGHMRHPYSNKVGENLVYVNVKKD